MPLYPADAGGARALVSVAGGLHFPGNSGRVSATRVLATSDTLDAAAEYTGMVVRAKEAMVVSHVAFRTGTVAGSPTLDVRIETVDATTGLPTGTLWATTTNIVSGALASNTWYLLTFTSTATIARGDVFCVKFAYNSGTSVQVSVGNGMSGTQSGFPYGVRNTGTPAKFLAHPLVAALGSSASTFYCIENLVPATPAAVGINTGTYDAHGARFKVPVACRVSGIVFPVTSTYGEFTAGIYSDAGAELSSTSTAYDIDQIIQSTGVALFLNFDNSVELAADTWYRAAIWPTTATSTTIYVATIGAADYRSALPIGPDFHYTRKAIGGAWDDTLTTQYPVLDLMIDMV